MTYRVKYYYLATGMEGHADEMDYGIVHANSKKEAVEKIVSKEYPVDEFYGPGNRFSSRSFLRSCLLAEEVKS